MNHFAILVLSFLLQSPRALKQMERSATCNLVASDFRVNKGHVHILKTTYIQIKRTLLLVNKQNPNLWLTLSKGPHVARPLIRFVAVGIYSTS